MELVNVGVVVVELSRRHNEVVGSLLVKPSSPTLLRPVAARGGQTTQAFVRIARLPFGRRAAPCGT